MLQTLRRATAYQLYLLLVVVNLATLAFALYLTMEMTATHRKALRADRVRLDDQMRSDRTRRLAGDFDEAADELFRTHDHARAKARLRICAERFREELADYRSNVSRSRHSGAIGRDLDAIEAAMNRMTTAAAAMIAFAERDQYDAAAGEMAHIDRHFELLRRRFDAIASRGRERSAAIYALDDTRTSTFSRAVMLLCGVLGTFVLAIGLYSTRVVREMVTAQQRKRYLSQLEERERELENAIAERDVQTERLREQQELLAQTERIAEIGSWEASVPLGMTEKWSDQKYRLLGYEPGEIEATYATVIARVPKEEQSRVLAMVQEFLEDPSSDRLVMEHAIVRPDGARRIMRNDARIIRDASGAISRLFGFAQDITERRTAEEALRLSEERFQNATRATQDLIWDWTVDSDVRWLNDVFTEWYGYPAHGDTSFDAWFDNVHPEDAERVRASFMDAVESDAQYWSDEYRYRTFQGEWRDVLDRGYIVRNGYGKAVRAIGAVMDVTSQNRAARDIAALSRQNELILNSVADGLFGLDMDGTAQYVNRAAADMLGWRPEDLVGTRVHEVMHHSYADGRPMPREECNSAHALARGEFGMLMTNVFWTRSGLPIPVEQSSSRVFDETGTMIGVVTTFRDISERQAVDRMKGEFISTVSHELRTPLTSIRGALGLLVSGRLGIMPEKAGRLLEIAVNNTDRLVRLINDILDTERMESGNVTLTRKTCNAAHLIEEAVETVRTLAEREQIAIAVQAVNIPIEADADRIIQTLTNLLSNAVKFSPASSTIEIACIRRPDDVLFTVRDHGRGVPGEKRETIFEPFQQVDASDSRDKGGTGLGLAICRTIVRQHEGEIWVDDRPGGGSLFSFTIPFPVSEVPPETRTPLSFTSTRSGDPNGQRKPRMLIVEDDLDLAGVLAASFERYGVDILHAATGGEALELVRRVPPDLIVLDFVLPDMDGFAFVKDLGRLEGASAIPLVVYSASEPSEAERERLSIGPTQFFIKSRVSPEEFERRVVVLLDDIAHHKVA